MGSRSAATRRRAQHLAAFLLCAVLALAGCACLLAGCSSSSSATGTAGSPSPSGSTHPGGTYNFPLDYTPMSLTPFGDQTGGNQVQHQIFEGLVAYATRSDGTLVVAPALAQSWSANADATVWTFKLRRGVRFQAPVGREVTAQDVVADFRYGTDRANHAYVSYMYQPIAGTDADGYAPSGHLGVQALDRYTVRFALKQPFASFPDTLGNPFAWVWPVDYLRRVGRARFEDQPVGTGPFLLSRWVRGQSIDLVRNPDWWDAASGQPYVDRIHFRIFPSVSAELQAFQSGLVDYTWVPQGQVAASRTLPQVRGGSWSAQTAPILALTYLAFNMDDPVLGGKQGLPLRRAMSYLCDRQAMIEASSEGTFRLPTGLVPSILPGWQENMLPQTYDPATAAALYKQAGSPRLRLVAFDAPWFRPAARRLEASCAAAGIALSVRLLSWDDYLAMFTSSGGPPMHLTGWIADYPAADNFLYDVFSSRGSTGSLGTAYSDPAVDRLLAQARSTADPARRLGLNQRAAHEIIADLPVVPLFEFTDYRLTSNRIGGFRENGMSWVDMWELWVR